jgi:hypothetical protein
MEKNVLGYGRPETVDKRGGSISGWASLAISASIIPVSSTHFDAALPLVILAVCTGAYAIFVSRGRSIPGWIGLGFTLTIIGWTFFLLRVT